MSNKAHINPKNQPGYAQDSKNPPPPPAMTRPAPPPSPPAKKD